jgi:GDPmannose 4,6-dehydratase
MKIEWSGKGSKEVGFLGGEEIIKINPRYFRPTEVETLLGDASKAKDKLNWLPKITFEKLVKEMIDEDLKLAKNEKFIDH